ncbi:hypothetical protein ACIBL8_44280 [Streptomyces sp. NPDC050523]|uniref:hypothetical protein n=1 Tax=Streptomyces sp. NPDC050523 TaxID=3365622 RepID=UPI0037B63462
MNQLKASPTRAAIASDPEPEPRQRAEQAPADEAREHTEQATPEGAAEAAAQAVTASVAGLTTNPRHVADMLHDAIDDAQAQHLARPEVGGFPIDRARSAEAFSTAGHAMERALKLSDDPAGTAHALRMVLDMVAREAGA